MNTNNAVRIMNEPITSTLQNITGQDFGSDREAWREWWTDQQGYKYVRPEPVRKPTRVRYEVVQTPTARTHHSCFGKGTPVRTLTGRRSIEDLRVAIKCYTGCADRALGFQPIVAVFHNPPSPTLRVQLGDEEVIVTGTTGSGKRGGAGSWPGS